MDRISKEHRSWNMSRIKSKDTKPELAVRSFLHKNGFRFRLNGKVSKKIYPKGILPGKPDIVLPKYKTVIFVHGCFWHGHGGCKRATSPKTNKKYWVDKISSNKKRDSLNFKLIIERGLNIIVVWECELGTKKLSTERLEFLIKEIIS